MTSFRRDPYLWIHLAGLATVPLWLDVCLAGLAVGDPAVPPWVELTALVLVGTLPVLLMQWQKPFYIFSLGAIALRPDRLNPQRRQLLSLKRSWLSRVLVLAVAVGLLFLLKMLYQLTPIAADMTPLAGRPRYIGWGVCAIAFFGANVFAQVPATVATLLIRTPHSVRSTAPYPVDSILKDFTVIGLRVGRLLPSPEDEGGADDDAENDPSSSTEVCPEEEATAERTADLAESATAVAGSSEDTGETESEPGGSPSPEQVSNVAVVSPTEAVNEPDTSIRQTTMTAQRPGDSLGNDYSSMPSKERAAVPDKAQMTAALGDDDTEAMTAAVEDSNLLDSKIIQVDDQSPEHATDSVHSLEEVLAETEEIADAIAPSNEDSTRQ